MIATTPLIEELRAMPSDRLENTSAFIDSLLAERRARRHAMIDATAGCLPTDVGALLEEAMAECEVIPADHE